MFGEDFFDYTYYISAHFYTAVDSVNEMLLFLFWCLRKIIQLFLKIKQ